MRATTTHRYDLTTRHVEHIRNGTTDTHGDGARFVPAAEYTDPGVHDQERRLFRRVPLVAAASVQLASPGSYLARDVLDVPVLLVRQHDGTVSAFLNSCAHRGAAIVDGDGVLKSRARFTCPYHAWTYSADGRLASVNQEDKFGCPQPAPTGLLELPCDERHGLVFVVLEPHVALDLDAFLGDFDEPLRIADLGSRAYRSEWRQPYAINWKVALDTYFESYHVKFVHRRTIASEFIGNQSTHEAFGPAGQHFRTSWAMNAMAALVDLPDAEIGRRAEAEPAFLPFLYLFPNTIITAPTFAPLAHVIRVSPGTTPGDHVTELIGLCRPDADEAETAVVDEFLGMVRFAIDEEDYPNGHSIQRALNSGLKDGLRFGANEPTLTAIHRALAAAIGREAPDQG